MAKVKNKRNAGLADKVQAKKKDGVNKKKVNPFEVHINKEKIKVLGKKSKHDRGLPGVSRAKAIQKRKETIGTEMKLINKTNTFIDRRIGEKNNQLSAEDRMVARFAAERSKQHSKKNIYNLADDEILTHRGQTLEQIEKFDDPRSSDDEDEGNKFGGLDNDFVSEGHFGGGMLSKSDSKDGAKSHKDLIEQLIAESKKRKAEKQKEKEQTLDLTEKLDSEWKDLQPVVFKKQRVEEESLIDKLLNKAGKGQDYDTMMRELRFEKRGTPSDGLKTTEKQQEEERRKLEELEKQRQERMYPTAEIPKPTNTAKPFKHRSADDLEDNFELEDEKEFILAYDRDGMPKVPEHVLKDYYVPNAKKKFDDGISDTSSDDDNEEDEEETDEKAGSGEESEKNSKSEKSSDEDEDSDEEKSNENEEESDEEDEEESNEGQSGKNNSDSEEENVEESSNSASGPKVQHQSKKNKKDDKKADASSDDESRVTKSDVSSKESKVKKTEARVKDDSKVKKSESKSEVDSKVKKSEAKSEDDSKVKKSEAKSEDDSKVKKREASPEKESNLENSPAVKKVKVNGISSSPKGKGLDVQSEEEEDGSENETDDDNEEVEKDDIKKDDYKDLRESDQESEIDEGSVNSIETLLAMDSESDTIREMLEGKSPSQQSAVVHTLLKRYDPGLSEKNKELLSCLFAHLFQYTNYIFSNLANEEDIVRSFLIFDKFVPHFYKMVHTNKVSTKKFVVDVLKEKFNWFKRRPKKVPDLNTLVFFKLISLLYPTSDFRHPVTTPTLIFMTEILTLSRFRDRYSISRGLFITALILEFTFLSKRYVPEALNFLRGVLYLCANTSVLNPIQLVPPFRLHKDMKILHLEEDCSSIKVEQKMLSKDFLLENIDDDFKIRCLLTSTLMLKEFFDNYADIEALGAIFEPHLQLLDRVDLDLYPGQVTSIVTKVVQHIKQSLEVKTYTPLAREKVRPKALRLYEPDIQEVFTGSKNAKLSKEKAATARLKSKYKKEMKGALREIRRDKAYIASVKIKQKIQSDNVRKEKVKQIYKDASIQQGELNKLKRM